MFTGIIKSVGKIKSIRKGKKGIGITVSARPLSGLTKGASIAVNGTCYTATSVAQGSFSFFAMPETVRVTAVGRWKAGERVNIERPLRLGDEIGGHTVSGHVEGVGQIAIILREGRSRLWKVEAPAGIIQHLQKKGSVAIDGVSLTLADVGDSWFSVALIPYTLSHTTLGEKKRGDVVNLESDILTRHAKKRRA